MLSSRYPLLCSCIVGDDKELNDYFEPCKARPDDEVLGGLPFTWNINELKKTDCNSYG